MHVRCPHCHNPLEVIDDDSLQDLTCPSCGSSFNLIGRERDDVGSTTSLRQAGTMTIGHFELAEQLGQGQFGSVFKARDTQLDRTVAVKIPRRNQIGPHEAEQFFREARAAAQLKHPSIVGVHEVGREDGTIYIVSDFVEGVDLAEWLTGTQPTPREAAGLCAKIAAALHHAHDAGVVHRDLKPSNIMMDCDGEPHIMDFGLAKREAGEITMTVEGKVLGTPAYMSPEQAQGEAHHADSRSDVYSLGVILFELLTGERPFRGTTRMLLHQVINEEAPSPGKLNSQVPTDLETICLKCLEKEPNRRFESADELAGELRRYLAGEPLLSRPVSRRERLWRWSKRNPVIAALSAGLVGLLVFLLISGPLVIWREAILRTRAEQAATRASESESKAITAKQTAEVEARLANQARALEAASREEAEAAESRAQLEVDRAAIHAKAAELAKDQVVVSRDALRRNLYVAHMGLAHQMLEDANGSQLDQLLSQYIPAEDELDLRGFEWYYLHHALHRYESFPGWWASVTLSPDGKMLAVSNDGQTKILDSRTLLERQALPADLVKRAGATIFSPDQSHLVVAKKDGEVICWSLAAGELQWSAKLGPTCSSIAFSPDGDSLAVALGGSPAVVAVLDAEDGTKKTTLPANRQGEQISSVAFPADDRIIVGGYFGRIACRNVDSGEVIWETNAELNAENFVNSIDLSPDRSHIAVGTVNGVFRIHETHMGALVASQVDHQASINSVRYSPDGKWVASSSGDRTIRLRNVATGETQLQLLAGGWAGAIVFTDEGNSIVVGPVLKRWSLARLLDEQAASMVGTYQFQILPDGRKFVAISREKLAIGDLARPGQLELTDIPIRSPLITRTHEGKTEVWGTTGRRDGSLQVVAIDDSLETKTLTTGRDDLIGSIAISADGSLVATSDSNSIQVWNVEPWRMVREFMPLSSSTRGLKFDPATGDLLSRHLGGGVYRRQIESGDSIELVADQRVGPNRSHSFSADGNMIARSTGRTIWLTDTKDGETIVTFTGHADDVQTMRFLPDGRTLASGSLDNTVRLWDLETGALKMTLRGHAASVKELSDSPTGNALISRSNDGDVRFWRTNLEPVQPIYIRGITYSPDGNRIATYGGTGDVRVWDAKSLALLQTLSAPDLDQAIRDVRMVDFSPDSQLIAVAGYDLVVRVYSVETGETRCELTGHSAMPNAVLFTENGTRLLSQGNGQFAIWDLARAQRIAQFDSPAEMINSISHGHESEIVCGTNDGVQYVVDLQKQQTVFQAALRPGISTHAQQISSEQLICASHDGTVSLFDRASGEELASYPSEPPYLTACDVSEDGTFIAAQRLDGLCALLQLRDEQFQVVRRLQHSGQSLAVALAPDATQLVIGDEVGRATVWNAQTGEGIGYLNGAAGLAHYRVHGPDKKANLETSTTPVYFTEMPNSVEAFSIFESTRHHRTMDVEFSPDGAQLSVAADSTIRVTSTQTGEQLRLLEGHTYRINCLAYSPDGSLLASGSEDGKVILWDVATGQQVEVISLGRRISAIAFSRDGKILVHGSGWGDIGCWDIEERRVHAQIHLDGFNGVRVSTSGDGILATATRWQGKLQFWDLNTSETVPAPPTPDVIFAFGPNDEFVSARRNHLRKWDMETNQVVWKSTIPLRSWIITLAPSPTEPIIAVGSAAGEIYLVDSRDGSLRDHRPMRHLLKANALAWAPDGKTLASAGYEGVVKLWNPENGALLQRPGESQQEDKTIATITGMIAKRPRQHWLYEKRGVEYARRGRWRLAADDYRTATEMVQNAPFNWYFLAILLCELGEHEAYLEHCEAMLAKYQDTDKTYEVELTAVAGLIYSRTDDITAFVELAERSLENQQYDGYHRLLFTNGLACYRGGRYDEARTSLQQSIERNSQLVMPSTALAALNRLLLAMCAQQSGDHDSAVRELTEARKLVEPLPIPGVANPDDPDMDCWNWLIFQILELEGKSLIEGEK